MTALPASLFQKNRTVQALDVEQDVVFPRFLHSVERNRYIDATAQYAFNSMIAKAIAGHFDAAYARAKGNSVAYTDQLLRSVAAHRALDALIARLNVAVKFPRLVGLGEDDLHAMSDDISSSNFSLLSACFNVSADRDSALELFFNTYHSDFDLTPRGQTRWAAALRACEARWWLRKLRKIAAQQTENVFLACELIGGKSKSNATYASDNAVHARRHALAKQRDWLEQTQLVNRATGESFSLAEVAPTPRKRFSALYSRTKGLEAMAAAQGLEGFMYTATLEPRFHPAPTRGANSWDGTPPEVAAAELQQRWARARALLAFYRIPILGFWVKELHADQCPHLHVLVFHAPGRLDDVVRCLDTEFSHSDRSTDVRVLDPGRAGAATYMAEYIAKAVGAGAGEGDELADELAIENADRIEAASSLRAFRRYGFFGIRRASTLFNECRRVARLIERERAEGSSLTESMLSDEMTRAVTAAATSDWAWFLRELPASASVFTETYVNQYQEEARRVVGIEFSRAGRLVQIETHVDEFVRAGSVVANDSHLHRLTVIHSYPSAARAACPDAAKPSLADEFTYSFRL